jgi:NAD(P)-dependent dehydrogenase (short-subunit alcohol dehydrogenase family)
MTHAASKDDLRVSTLFDYTSHIVLVTGGATGLGEMAAQAFIQNGARVFIASRKESELASTTARLNALGPGKCSYIVADLKDKAGCLALCAELKKQTDRHGSELGRRLLQLPGTCVGQTVRVEREEHILHDGRV